MGKMYESRFQFQHMTKPLVYFWCGGVLLRELGDKPKHDIPDSFTGQYSDA